MSHVIIQNSTHPLLQPIRAKYCRSFTSKFAGLMMKPEIDQFTGILLVEKRDSRVETSIHMLFMRFDITVVWINSDMRVVDIKLARKWQPYLAPAQPASFVLETHPQQFSSFKIGDYLEFFHE